jgi:hypothetical protein
MTKGSVNIGGSMQPTGSLGMVLTSGNTGRAIPIGEGYYEAERWSKLSGVPMMLGDPCALRFLNELARASIVEATELRCVRGRKDPERMLRSWRNLLPPKPEYVKEGRYNTERNPALYACDCKEGVQRELRDPDEGPIAMLEFRIPTAKLRVADMTSANLSEFVHAAMKFAEDCRVEGRSSPMSYDFSQTIAHLVKDAGFDGMRVPGVKGDGGFRYQNIVIWTLTACEEWAQHENGFHPLALDP